MKKIIDYIAEELSEAFEKAGYDRTYGKVTLSNRPDLCEYQCNGAMAGAKAYKKAPFMIAEDVVALLKDSACMEEVEVVKPGFINIRLKKSFVADYLNQMEETDNLGIESSWRYPSWRLGISDGTDHHRIERKKARTAIF